MRAAIELFKAEGAQEGASEDNPALSEPALDSGDRHPEYPSPRSHSRGQPQKNKPRIGAPPRTYARRKFSAGNTLVRAFEDERYFSRTVSKAADFRGASEQTLLYLGLMPVSRATTHPFF